VSTYTDKIMAFDRWVAESFVREHLEEIDYQRELREHQARLRQLGTLRRRRLAVREAATLGKCSFP
jgi:hypothetical protein